MSLYPTSSRSDIATWGSYPHRWTQVSNNHHPLVDSILIFVQGTWSRISNAIFHYWRGFFWYEFIPRSRSRMFVLNAFRRKLYVTKLATVPWPSSMQGRCQKQSIIMGKYVQLDSSCDPGWPYNDASIYTRGRALENLPPCHKIQSWEKSCGRGWESIWKICEDFLSCWM